MYINDFVMIVSVSVSKKLTKIHQIVPSCRIPESLKNKIWIHLFIHIHYLSTKFREKPTEWFLYNPADRQKALKK